MKQQTVRRLLVLSLALVLSSGTLYAGWEEGVAAFKSGDFSTAATEFQAVASEQPDWPGGHMMLGQALLKLNRADDAIAALRKAYDLTPSDAGTQLALGQAYVAGRRYADAAALLGKINGSSLPSEQRSVLNQLLAVSLDKSGQAGAALDALAQAAASKPNDASVQYQYGAKALNAGDTDAAVSALGKAAQLSSDADIQKAYAQALLRKGRETRGDAKTGIYRQAVSALQKLVAANATGSHLEMLAGAQLGAKDFDGAIATAKRAASANSGAWLPHYYMAQGYTKKNQFASAESELRAALNKASSSNDKTTIWSQLGFVYEKQRNFDQAIAAYRQAGDNAGVQRAQTNKETEAFNETVEQENQAIEELQREAEELEKALRELPGGGGGTGDGGR